MKTSRHGVVYRSRNRIGRGVERRVLIGWLACFLTLVGVAACDSERKSTGAGASDDSSGGERRLASIGYRIGGNTNDPDYQLGEVRDLAILADHRFVVADLVTLRVALFDADGRFVHDIGRPGGGPGEFERPYGVDVDPDGDVWVRSLDRHLIFALTPTGATYAGSLPVRPSYKYEAAFSGDGRIGLTDLIAGHFGVRIWVDSVGNTLREDTLPAFADEDFGYGRITWQQPDGREESAEFPASFSGRDRLVQARTGGYARVVTSRYEIDLYGADGIRFRTIRRDHSGPVVSSAERRREESVIDSLATFYRQQPIAIRYQPGETPERKPPIENLWFDAEDRLWVRLWAEDGDSLTRAHVYSAAGEFVFNAAWPHEVSLEHGAIRGDVAIGFATDEFDVPEIVKMVFGPG